MLLRSFVRGERARALRVQLAAQHPESSSEEVEDAVQYACKSFLDEAQGISDPGQVYAKHQVREVAVDPLVGGLDESASEDPTPEEELIGRTRAKSRRWSARS